MKRRGIGKKLRFEVLKRDGFTCQYCGGSPPYVVLHIDHILAIARGGNNDLDNLTTSCQDCNLGKGAQDLSAIPLSFDQKAKKLAEQEYRLRQYHEAKEDRVSRLETEAMQIANRISYKQDRIFWSNVVSIKKFLDQIPYHDVADAMDIAISKRIEDPEDIFRYFCGICWKFIREGSRPNLRTMRADESYQ